MDLKALEVSAKNLRTALEHYKNQEHAAALLFQEMDALINRALKHEINSPMEPRDIPGHRYFTETSLGAYHDLEEAYASFYLQLIDAQNSKAFLMLQAKMKGS